MKPIAAFPMMLLMSLAVAPRCDAGPGARFHGSLFAAASFADPVRVDPPPPGGLAAAPAGADSAAALPRFAPAAGRRFWSTPEGEGSWLGQDKMLHASICYATALTLRAAGAPPATAIAVPAGMGVLKELHDSWLRPRNAANQGASRRDLAADLFGLTAAAMVFHLWLH